MAKKYPLLNLRGSNYKVAEERIPGEKKRIIEGNLIVDRSCFAKTKREKAILKLAKLQCKIDELRK